MSFNTTQKTKKLLNCIGAIADTFLDETKLAEPSPVKSSKKRIITYSAIGVGVASVGIAIAAVLLKQKRTAVALGNVA